MEDQYTALWSWSMARAASGQYDEAAKGYQQCLRLLPSSRDAPTLAKYRTVVIHLALAFNHLGRFGEAVEFAERALLLGPTPYGRALGLAVKGEALYGLGRFAEGADTFKQALVAHNEFGPLRVADAMVRLALDDMLYEAESLLSGRVSNFYHPEAEAERQILLGKIRVRQDQNKAEALSLVSKGEALYGLGRFAEGAEAFEQALKADAVFGRLRVADAVVRLAIDSMLDRTEKLLESVTFGTWTDQEVQRRILLGKIYVRQGRRLRARDQFYEVVHDYRSSPRLSKLSEDAKGEMSKVSLTVSEMQEYCVAYAHHFEEFDAILRELSPSDRKKPLIVRLRKVAHSLDYRSQEVDVALPYLLAIGDEDCFDVIRESFFTRKHLNSHLLSTITARRDARWLPDLTRFLSKAASLGPHKREDANAYKIAARGILDIIMAPEVDWICVDQLDKIAGLRDYEVIERTESISEYSDGWGEHVQVDRNVIGKVSLSEVREAALKKEDSIRPDKE
jgi:tetratricopeptide (TPR) repeat protein